MLTFVDVKFISIVPVYIWGSLGDEGLCRSANIPQIADVVRRVVFLLLILAMFSDNRSP